MDVHSEEPVRAVPTHRQLLFPAQCDRRHDHKLANLAIYQLAAPVLCYHGHSVQAGLRGHIAIQVRQEGQ